MSSTPLAALERRRLEFGPVVAEEKLALLKQLAHTPGALAFNAGSGRTQSVQEVVMAFERACGRKIGRLNAPRRPGDVAGFSADIERGRALGWRPTRGLDAICADTWRWQKSGSRY